MADSSDFRDDAPVNRSALRVMQILDFIADAREGVSLTDLARMLDLPKSTAHGVLQAMRSHGYLTWDAPTKRYSIGLRVIALASAAPLQRTLQRAARRYLESLSSQVMETVTLGMYEPNSVTYIDKVESTDPVRFTVPLGERRPLHCTSMGKLYLASLSDDEARRLLERTGVPQLTPATLTDVDRLVSELGSIRRRGYSTNNEESIDGVVAIAAPIAAPGTRMLAAMAVVGGDRIRRKQDEIVEQLKRTVAQLGEELAYD